MAKKEAYCPQCGSLIQVDDSKEKSECIFCKSSFETSRSIALNTDSESRLLLQKATEQRAKEELIAQQESDKLNRGTKPSGPVAKVNKEEIVLRPLPMKVKIKVFAAFISLVVIISAIMIPTILNRNAKRAVMDSQLASSLGFEMSSHVFRFNNNRDLIVATGETLTESDAEAAFNGFTALYAKAYDKAEADIREKIELTIYDIAGRYICTYSNGATTVSFETATPTKVPTPTQSITSS